MLHGEVAPALLDKRGVYTSHGMLSRLGAKKLKARVEDLLQQGEGGADIATAAKGSRRKVVRRKPAGAR